MERLSDAVRAAARPAAARLVAWLDALVVWLVRRGDRRRDAASLAARARQELAQGRPGHAIQTSGYAIAADPAYAEGYRQLALAHLAERRLDAARAAARRGLAADPRSPGLLAALGDVDLEAGDAAAAAAAYRRALGLGPPARAAAVLRFKLGDALLRQGRPDEAAEEWLRAHQLDPGYHRASWALGEVRAHQGRHDEAVRWLAEHVARRPGNAHAHYLLAYSLGQLGRWEEAAGEARRAAELAPGEAGFGEFSLVADHEAATRRQVRESGN